MEGLYSQATGEDYQPPEPVCVREMEALATFFEATHGEARNTQAATTEVAPTVFYRLKCHPHVEEERAGWSVAAPIGEGRV